MKNMRSTSIPCLALSLLAGCATGPDYKRPDIDAPAKWRVDYEGTADLANTAWWETFQDPVLNNLIQTALRENKDLLIAASRVEQFKARVDIARSGFYPQFGYGAAATRDRYSENRPIPLPRGTSASNSNFEIGATANWELDVWGRIRRSSEAARAELLSSVENQHVVIMILVSDVATSYVELLALDKELEIAKGTRAVREKSLQLFEQKYAGGAVSALEVAQVRSLYEEAAATEPELERQIALVENALSVLLGHNPDAITRDRSLDTLPILPVPKDLPSDILARRPDVRQAEQDLIAANARIGVARAQYFPAISLTGLFGYASSELSELLSSTSSFGAIGPTVSGPIFSGGRISGQVRETKAIQQQLLVSYLQTIQGAFRDVDDALISHQKLGEQISSENRRVSALRDYVRLANSRYDGGQTSYLEVLDAERSLYRAEIRRTEVQRDLYSALIAIYKAMGGGWPMDAETAAVH